jgi:hypothetical protein
VKLCADVRLGDAGGIARIPRRDETRSYAVMAAPLPARTALTGTQPNATPVLILIHDPSAQERAGSRSDRRVGTRLMPPRDQQAPTSDRNS